MPELSATQEVPFHWATVPPSPTARASGAPGTSATARSVGLDALALDALAVTVIEEQNRITRELAQAGGELANSEVDWETVSKRVSAAIKLVASCMTSTSEPVTPRASGSTRPSGTASMLTTRESSEPGSRTQWPL